MTPTLFGRWQSRLFLLWTFGFIITCLFILLTDNGVELFWVLGYVTVIGFVWDILYNFVQTYRWDRDWPPAFQVIAGIIEALLIWGLVQIVNLPGLVGAGNDPAFTGNFLRHYSVVWFITFLASLSFMRIMFPRWRFYGGQWLSRWETTR